MADVAMPRLSDSMEEGTILKWLKSDGDEIKRGEELVEIETDKANMTYESDLDGVLKIVAQEGDTLAVGETIARIGEDAGGDEQAEEPEPAREEQEQEPEPARADVPRAEETAPEEAPAAEEAPKREVAKPVASADTGKGETTVEELTRLQQTIARRMAESKATAPEFVITCEVDMEDAVAFRRQLKAASGENPAPSFNDFVVKASALALR